MHKDSKTPALRFAGFTGPWQQRKLGEIADEVVRTDVRSTAPIMMITAQNGFIKQSERYGFNNSGESLKKYILLFRGELAYNHGASKLRPYGSCFALITQEKARVPFVYHCFSIDANDPEFIAIMLNGIQVEGQLRQIVSSGARMDGLLNISYQEYAAVSLLLPKTEEQFKISTFFRNLDHLITSHQRKIDQLVNIKKSCLEKMFPQDGSDVPEVRFAGFTGAWQRRKLGEVAKIVGGGTPSTSNSDYWNGCIDWYSPTEIGDKVYADGSIKTITQSGYEKCSAKILPANRTVLFTSRAGIGDMAILRCSGATNQGFQSLVLRDGFDTYFVYSSGYKIKEYALTNASGSTFLEISGKQLGNMDYLVPSIREQTQIGTFFRNLDNLITLNRRKLDKLRNLKKACLENMFV